jgi:hypothetical protein
MAGCENVRRDARSDRVATNCSAILACVPKIGDDRGQMGGTSAAACVSEQQEFKQVFFDRRARGL